MSDPTALSRDEYDSCRQALLDALRVATDLADRVASGGELLVTSTEVEFLVRRIAVLVEACLNAEGRTW